MTSARYIIHRVNLDIEAPDEPTARRLQDEAARIFNHWIMPRLEELLERLVPGNKVLRIDRLDLDLDALDPAGFEQGFGEALFARLKERIEDIVAAAAGDPGAATSETCTVLTEEERLYHAFLHFLETGGLPWWSERAAGMFEEEGVFSMLERRLQTQATETQRLAQLLAVKSNAAKRLLFQFSPDLVGRLLRLLLFLRKKESPLSSGEEFALLADMVLQCLTRGIPVRQPAALPWLSQAIQVLLAWQLTPATAPNRPVLERLLEEISSILRQSEPVDNRGGALPRAKRRSPPRPPDTDNAPLHHEDEASEPEETEAATLDGLVVDNAGLVLLHPFLEYFFREFDLLDGKDFRGANTCHLAVHLLHYLATGQGNTPEYLLTFEKFFCGLDLLAPVPRRIELSDRMKMEGDKLLRAAIGHWKALKSTSPAGLREGFLQRPGKLIPGSFENRLIVEAKSHDVLLSYLPWGYGILKLPWMQLPLVVDWVG